MMLRCPHCRKLIGKAPKRSKPDPVPFIRAIWRLIRIEDGIKAVAR